MKTIVPIFHTIIITVGLGFLPHTQAVVPPPDGGYPNFTTAEGTKALQNLTTGTANTGLGWYSLFSDMTGSFNTGVGAATLVLNTGDSNTATGTGALFLNTIGVNNTANGAFALLNNADGDDNTAIGFRALFANTSGDRNTAVGFQALANGTDTLNFANTATGHSALFTNTSGQANTAMGAGALFNNVDGNSNTAVGSGALTNNTSGNSNIAIGQAAGGNLTIGDRNIDIGNTGVAGESNKIRIGTVGTQDGTFIAGIGGTAVTGVAVLVSNDGQLGVMASSQRFKEAIKAMDTASEAIFALNPVTFHYAKEIDPAATAQFGLVAEEVEKANPNLVVRDKEGKPYTVRYEAVNAMLLNEFLKAHRKMEEQASQIEQQAATISHLKKEIETVIAHSKEQDLQIQRVSDQVQINTSDARLAATDQ